MAAAANAVIKDAVSGAPPLPYFLLTVWVIMQHGSLFTALSSFLCKIAEINREMTWRQQPRGLTEECVSYYLLVSHFCASHKHFSPLLKEGTSLIELIYQRINSEQDHLQEPVWLLVSFVFGE